MNRKNSISPSATLIALALAGCGSGGSDSPPKTAAAPSTAASPAAAPSPEPGISTPARPLPAPAPVPAPVPTPPAPTPVVAGPPAPIEPDPARTLQYSYPSVSLDCGRGMKWYPAGKFAINYANGSLGIDDSRNSSPLRFQIDSAAEKQEYEGSTGYFQTSIGYRAWVIVDLAGSIIGAGYHQNTEASYVLCGSSLVAADRDPASVFPTTADAKALTCYYLTGPTHVETFYIREKLLYSIADPGIVPVNGIAFGPDPESAGGNGYFLFHGATDNVQRLMLQDGKIKWISGISGRNCS